MKNIQDYLHLYLGCECLQPFKDKGKTHIISIHTNGLVQVAHSTGSHDFWNIEYIKPLLRKLRDMSEEEKNHIDYQAYQIFRSQQVHPPTLSPAITWAANQTFYLLSKHFDLFGLIEAGLALDATKIQK